MAFGFQDVHPCFSLGLPLCDTHYGKPEGTGSEKCLNSWVRQVVWKALPEEEFPVRTNLIPMARKNKDAKQGRQTRTPSMRKVREPTGLTGHFSVSGSASRPCRIAQGQGCESHGSGHDTKSPLAPPLLQIVFNGISLGDHPVRFSAVDFRPSGCDGCHEWGSKPLMPD